MQRNRNISSKSWIRKMDFVFYHEREIREAVLEERNTCAMAPIVRNASGVTDPTAREAIYNLTPLPVIKINGQELRLPELWLVVIEKTYAKAKEENNLCYEVAKRKYKGMNYKKICIELHISVKFQYLLLENFRKYAAWLAKEFELIKIEEYEKTFF